MVLAARVPSEVHIARFKKHFEGRKGEINARLEHFSNVLKDKKEVLFEELVFCLLTPQSKARFCDAAVANLKAKGLLFTGEAEEIAVLIQGDVRFHNNKAKWIVEAREKFFDYKLDFSDIPALRDQLVRDFKGLGYKEASHFLRNIGFGEDLAILDRHILKNLVKVGVLEEVPKSMSPGIYFNIENQLKSLCSEIGITPAQLDLLFWSEETGEIFK